MHVDEAHELCDHLEQGIAEELPETDIVIHVEPCANLDCRQLRDNGQWVSCLEEDREKAEKGLASGGA